MATTDDIARRVEEADSVRSARRTKAAQLIGGLARERTAVVQRLSDIDQQIGDEIVECGDVISIEELATFIDVPVVELNQVVATRKPARGRRRRSTASPRAGSGERAQATAARRQHAAPASDSAGVREETP